MYLIVIKQQSHMQDVFVTEVKQQFRLLPPEMEGMICFVQDTYFIWTKQHKTVWLPEHLCRVRYSPREDMVSRITQRAIFNVHSVSSQIIQAT